jgi:hypothetical protein
MILLSQQSHDQLSGSAASIYSLFSQYVGGIIRHISLRIRSIPHPKVTDDGMKEFKPSSLACDQARLVVNV